MKLFTHNTVLKSWHLYQVLTLILVALTIFFPLIIAGHTFINFVVDPSYNKIVGNIFYYRVQQTDFTGHQILYLTLLHLKNHIHIFIYFGTIIVALIITCLLFYVLISMRISQGNRVLIELVANLEHAGAKKIMEPRALASFEYDTTGYLANILLKFQKSVINYSQKLTKEIEQSTKIKNELSIAHQLQQNMLPTDFFSIEKIMPNIKIHATLKPAGKIAGDLYDFFALNERYLFFIVGDVCGKGIPACIDMARVITLFRALVRRHFEIYKEKICLATLFTILNNSLTHDNPLHVFITAFAGILDVQTGNLQYTNAGHNLPVHIHQQQAQFLPAKRFFKPLALTNNTSYKIQSLTLQQDDILFIYTDGLVEARNNSNQEFGDKRLLKALNKKELPPQMLNQHIIESLNTFTEEKAQHDDISLLSLQWAEITQNKFQGSIKSNLDELYKLQDEVGAYLEKNHINKQDISEIKICIEEAVSNIIMHGYKNNHGVINVEISLSGHHCIMLFKDQAPPYDPTAKIPIDLKHKQQKTGGRGIYLLAKLCDHMQYDYENMHNILTITKELNQGKADGHHN